MTASLRNYCRIYLSEQITSHVFHSETAFLELTVENVVGCTRSLALLSRISLLHHDAKSPEQLHSIICLRAMILQVLFNNLNLDKDCSIDAVVQLIVSINFISVCMLGQRLFVADIC